MNAAIRQVFHPSGKAEPLGLDHGVFPEHHALYAAYDPDGAMHMFHRVPKVVPIQLISNRMASLVGSMDG